MKINVVLSAVLPLIVGSSYAASADRVPEELRASTDETLLLEASGKGVQIYVCVAGNDQPAHFEWALKAPDAELFAAHGKKIGKHYAGPTWELSDGSTVVGALKSRSDSPDPHSIPWLLLTAKTTSGSGTLSGAKSIQRLKTSGGKAPDRACDQGNVGEQVRVPYAAEYYFYGTKR